jgi:hypothetical protein
METAKASRRTTGLIALAIAVAAAAFWASIALAGGSGSSGSTPGSPASDQVAYFGDIQNSAPQQDGESRDGNCPERDGGSSGEQQDGGESSGSDTGSSV